MAEPTQELQSETSEAERQTHSLFRDSSSVALQTLTDLVELEVVTTVRRLAAQKHSVALAQMASRISANKKFGVGADDDPGASLRSRGPDSVSIRRTDFVHEPRSAIRSKCGGGFDRQQDFLPRCSEQCLAAQTVWIGLDKDTCQIELQ